MKRGVEMSLQTVVIAVIVLFIAVLLMYLVGKAVQSTGQTVDACTERGGECQSSCTDGKQPFGQRSCGEGQTCCIDPSLALTGG